MKPNLLITGASGFIGEDRQPIIVSKSIPQCVVAHAEHQAGPAQQVTARKLTGWNGAKQVKVLGFACDCVGNHFAGQRCHGDTLARIALREVSVVPAEAAKVRHPIEGDGKCAAPGVINPRIRQLWIDL
jgi:hypothetical protein